MRAVGDRRSKVEGRAELWSREVAGLVTVDEARRACRGRERRRRDAMLVQGANIDRSVDRWRDLALEQGLRGFLELANVIKSESIAGSG